MLFIAYGCQNNAVWYALKLHVEFVQETRKNISFLVDEKHYNIVKKDYPNRKIETYSSFFNLMVKLIRTEEKHIFSPVVFTTVAGFIASQFYSKKFYFWMQGAIPEESFLRHQSKLRYYILATFEYFALLISYKNIFVSSYMKRYMEKKLHRKFNNSIVVPCISEFTYNGSKKEKDSFVYIGGMSAWQKIDIMLEMFNKILEWKPHAKLYIATLEGKVASELIQKYIDPKYCKNIELLRIENRIEIATFLSTKEYGFLIREDIVVNNVSSPIKLAEYLSCGVNVLISCAVKSYAPIIASQGAGIQIINSNDIVKDLKGFSSSTEHALKVYKNYFSKEKHLLNYKHLIE